QDRYPISSSQTRLFESLRQILLELLTGPQPGVFFIDDLQWADSASLDLLIYLVRRLQDYPVFIVTAWRNEGALNRLTGLLAESQRAGLGTKINLDRLTFADVEKLAADVESITPERLQTLFDETEGLPYFVVEYLTATRQGNDWTLLTSVQDLQRARLAGLDETARQILATASVIGRSFEFNTLHDASGRSEEETITGLETLLSRGLLVEYRQKEGIHPSSFTLSYDFTHEKIRTVVYEDSSLARRRLLHRRVAEVIMNRSRDIEESAARIAHHYQRAGQDAEAAIYYHRAGGHARKLYANAEGLSHYQTALALGHPEPCALHEAIGDLQTLQGDYRAAVASYETAAALANPDSLARIEYKLANLHHRRGDYDLATSYFQSALDATGKQSELRAQTLADWSRTCARQGDHVRAVELAEEALALSRLGADPIPGGQAHNVLGMIARQAGDPPRAAGHLQQALEIAESENHLPAQIAALNNLALVYEDQQDYPRAVELAQNALDLCARLGDRHREAALRNRLADLFHASNQPSAAMYHLKKAVEIFAEIGGGAGENEPEIWKLTEW
ncbi:MAG TPA: tetratricopeptide repeat protein, partial [Anaerolineales bacterium]|nr:tetratricopeptide repeat protein [Anaerolineales bacterium]